MFVEVVGCFTGADSGGRRWIGGAGSSRRHGCHRRGRFFFFLGSPAALALGLIFNLPVLRPVAAMVYLVGIPTVHDC